MKATRIARAEIVAQPTQITITFLRWQIYYRRLLPIFSGGCRRCRFSLVKALFFCLFSFSFCFFFLYVYF